jgi:hypothetical protein
MTINIFNVWVKCNLIIVTESGNVQSMDKNDNRIHSKFTNFHRLITALSQIG